MTTRSETRTYEIKTSDGLIRMDIPETWKVTYGPVSPGQKYSDGGNALRVYETDTKQRAIFLNVTSFRDLSIPIKRLLVKERGSDKWEQDRNGSKRQSKTVIERKWVDEAEYDAVEPES